MLENKYDIVMQQGSNYSLVLTVKDSNGNNKDLSGYSARMQIRPSYGSSIITESLSTGSGDITIDTGNSNIYISLSAERTANIKVDLSGNKKPPSSSYVYDMEFIDSNDFTYKLIYGDVTVYGEVTR